jgi:uncharacterized membrane protein YgaE (UPF0421/DUF939 family)
VLKKLLINWKSKIRTSRLVKIAYITFVFCRENTDLKNQVILLNSEIDSLKNRLNNESSQKAQKENELLNLNTRLTELENLIQLKDESHSLLKKDNENILLELENAKKTNVSLVIKLLIIIEIINSKSFFS